MARLDAKSYKEEIKARAYYGQEAIAFALNIIASVDWAYQYCQCYYYSG